MDGNYLKVFDLKDGAYLYQIDAKGNGPGELPICSFADVNNKQNSILLGYAGKLLQEYDSTGKHVRTYPHSFKDINFAPHNLAIYTIPFSNFVLLK